MTNNPLIRTLLSFAVETNHLTDYMYRWWLFKKRDKQRLQIRLHNILRSDYGVDMHDHPWWYLTIILRGGYYEYRPISDYEWTHDLKPTQEIVYEEHWDIDAGKVLKRAIMKQWYGAGSVIFRHADSLHRLEIPQNASNETWTLFITGKKTRSWGFLSKEGWIWHRAYNKENR